MKLLLDSFWRALAYCFLPRVWLLTLLPLVLMVAGALGLGYFFWESAVSAVQASLESSALLAMAWNWLSGIGLGGLKTVVAPLIVIALATPVLVVCTMLVVAFAMTPAMVSLVGSRRFPTLVRKAGASWWASLWWTLGSTAMALFALLLSIPLWVILPLVLVLPPLIWGWLTYRVMAFDALAQHASVEERRELFKRHRLPLLTMGLLSGAIGAAPGMIWASSAFAAALFALLAPMVIWLYTFIFTLTSLWFAHYCLATLEQLRATQLPQSAESVPVQLLDAPNQGETNALK